MFRLFSRATTEKKLLLKNDSPSPLNEVKPISVSKPFNIARKFAEKKTYDEIQACLVILNDAKKNLTSYRKSEEKHRIFLTVFNLACLLAAPGATFTLMFRLHEYLTTWVTPILSGLNQAIQERDSFISWYDNELDKQYKLIDKYLHPESDCGYDTVNHAFLEFNSACKYNRLSYTGPHGYLDLCALDPTTVYPIEPCLPQVLPLCEAEKKYFACFDTLYEQGSQAEQSLQQFKGEHVAHINSLNQRVNDFQSSIDSYSTWEPISTVTFTLTASACFSLAIYLFKNWRIARNEYKEDLARNHSLDECLIDSEHLPRIINLATSLDISLKNIPIEIFIYTLESRKLEIQPKEARISFLKAAHRIGLPDPVTKKILDYADILNPSPKLRP
jgi:hypothetical protein